MADPIWLKDDKLINGTSGGVLTFERIGSGDVGWYQCSVVHDGETFSSIGYFLSVKPVMADDSTLKNSATTRSVAFPENVVAGRVSYEERVSGDEPRTECHGCCVGLNTGLKDLQEKLEYYQSVSTGPRIERADPSDASDALTQVTLIICDDPETIFWITPTDRVVRPGGVTVDGFFASPVIALNDSCISASLSVDAATAEADSVTLVARNRHGMSDFVLRLPRPDPEIVISAEISSSWRHRFDSVTLCCVIGVTLLLA